MKNNKKGFTLIELLVVVLIIGVLAAMALPAYFRAVERSRMSEAELIMGNVIQAQQRYKLRRGQGYTTNWLALDTAPAGVVDGKSLMDNTTFCTKTVKEGTLSDGLSDGTTECGNGFTIQLVGTADTSNASTVNSYGVKSSDDKAGVIATRVNNDQYGTYRLFRYYDDPSHHTYCDVAGITGTNAASQKQKAEALCIDFTNNDKFVAPGCLPGATSEAKAYGECNRGDKASS